MDSYSRSRRSVKQKSPLLSLPVHQIPLTRQVNGHLFALPAGSWPDESYSGEPKIRADANERPLAVGWDPTPTEFIMQLARDVQWPVQQVVATE